MTITPQDLVRREVHYCVSSLVHTLACTFGREHLPREMEELADQAYELAMPIEDWEEAAREAGWELTGAVWAHDDRAEAETSPEAACCASDIEPYQHEVYEHWIVSDWLANALAAKGEKVDKDFSGLTVWARTTTGQAICMDHVIQQICADLNGEEG